MLTEPDVCYKIRSMKQASLNLDLLSKKTRKQTFLEEMEKVVPWADLEALIAPYYCEGVKGWPPFALQTMLRTHFMQQWAQTEPRTVAPQTSIRPTQVSDLSGGVAVFTLKADL